MREVSPKSPFEIVRCHALGMPTGERLRDARDLLHGVRRASHAVLEHHLLHCYLRPDFEVSSFPNDFAIWAAEALENLRFAEALSGIDPYRCRDWEEIRERMIDLVEEELWEDRSPRTVSPGRELHLQESLTFVVHPGGTARDLPELRDRIDRCRPSAVYHHVHRASFRDPEARNDFSRWVEGSLGLVELARDLERIDFPYYTLEELRWQLLDRIDAHLDREEETSS